jgi:hypothetical protein
MGNSVSCPLPPQRSASDVLPRPALANSAAHIKRTKSSLPTPPWGEGLQILVYGGIAHGTIHGTALQDSRSVRWGETAQTHAVVVSLPTCNNPLQPNIRPTTALTPAPPLTLSNRKRASKLSATPPKIPTAGTSHHGERLSLPPTSMSEALESRPPGKCPFRRDSRHSNLATTPLQDTSPPRGTPSKPRSQSPHNHVWTPPRRISRPASLLISDSVKLT